MNFEFLHVTPGSYYIVAGSDVDADGIICQRGELCGIYGSAEMPFSLEGMDLWGVDFSIGEAEPHPLQYREAFHRLLTLIFHEDPQKRFGVRLKPLLLDNIKRSALARSTYPVFCSMPFTSP